MGIVGALCACIAAFSLGCVLVRRKRRASDSGDPAHFRSKQQSSWDQPMGSSIDNSGGRAALLGNAAGAGGGGRAGGGAYRLGRRPQQRVTNPFSLLPAELMISPADLEIGPRIAAGTMGQV
jgi:hypothetical protein